MNSYLMTISYRGTRYSGWQKQTQNKNTIQEVLERTLSPILDYSSFQLISASRTDTGVHALDQKCKLVTQKKVSPVKLLRGLNAKLPFDVRIEKINIIENDFNLQSSILTKLYYYDFSKKPVNALENDLIYYHPDFKQLNINILNDDLSHVPEQVHFSYLTSSTNYTHENCRKIFLCRLQKINKLDSDYYRFQIEAEGFTKYAIRYFLGALFLKNFNQVSSSDLQLAYKGKKHLKLQKKLPATGLKLAQIKMRN
ncbi:MAG: hypothetical protein QF441_11340 [Bacteriovoracaceae bacterium]|nr:hypothetical protein [Bacteriovoracaceae bacterium]